MFEGVVNNYTGLSTDTKPTTAGGQNMLNGSRFREVDTEKVWHYLKSNDTWYLSSPRLDKSTHTLQTIEYEHHEIHSGSSFVAHFDNTTTNNNDHRSVIAFTTPDNAKWAHLMITVIASSPAEFYILEDPATIDLNEGNEITIFNRNRNSMTTSTMLSLENPAVAGLATTFIEGEIAGAQLTGGTVIEHALLAGGEGPKAIGGVNRGSQEWVLKQGKTYLFVLQNVGASANIHEIHLDWYEHQDKA